MSKINFNQFLKDVNAIHSACEEIEKFFSSFYAVFKFSYDELKDSKITQLRFGMETPHEYMNGLYVQLQMFDKNKNCEDKEPYPKYSDLDKDFCKLYKTAKLGVSREVTTTNYFNNLQELEKFSENLEVIGLSVNLVESKIYSKMGMFNELRSYLRNLAEFYHLFNSYLAHKMI